MMELDKLKGHGILEGDSLNEYLKDLLELEVSPR